MSMDIDVNADAYFLTERELKILLAGTSHNRVFGLLSEKAARSDESRSDVLHTLSDMVRFNKVEGLSETFRINEMIKPIIMSIGSSSHCLTVKLNDADIPLICYCGESAVLCKRVEYQPSILRLKQYDPDALARELVGSIALPDGADKANHLTEFSLWNKTGKDVFYAELFHDGLFQMSISVRIAVTDIPEIIVERLHEEKSVFEYDGEQFIHMLSNYLRLSDGGCANDS